MNQSIPVYRPDGSLYDCVSPQKLAKLEKDGFVAHVVRHRKGHINRAILCLRPGDPRPLAGGDVAGTRYSFKERLEHGRAWDLKHLGDDRDCKTYAPPDMRDAFLQVLIDCAKAPDRPQQRL